MNKIIIFLMIVITALSFSLATTMQSKAQDKSYSGIVPFATSGNRLGFLDQSNGRVYIYDSDTLNCLFVGQIQSLGKPIQMITSTTVHSINE
jgi:hypothetical protein